MSSTISMQHVFGIKEVVKEGLCIGCGTCTNQSQSVSVQFNRYGELTADLSSATSDELTAMDKTCPFSNASPNESALAEIAFKSEQDIKLNEVLGYHNNLFAGFSNTHRAYGSSGGIVSWLLAHVLTSGTVDAVIVVGRNTDSDRFFDFKVITDPQELQTTGTSFYYPVSYDKVLKYIQENPGRYAITGVPCFHKALRQLKLVNPIIAERVVLQIGIVCGQMKSSFYLEYLDRKAGKTSALIDACFRRKDETSRADDYLFEGKFLDSSGQVNKRTVRNREIGSNWAMGLFKPKACDFCDDVFAETADVAVMDAWLDQYVNDGKGTSLIIARNQLVNHCLELGAKSGSLTLSEVTANQVIESQRGGLNHRRAGLPYRLHTASNNSVPKKRIAPSASIDPWMKVEQKIRNAIRTRSREAMFAQIQESNQGLTIFDKKMHRVLATYKWFLRFKQRLAKRRDYSNSFKLDQ